MSTYSLRSPDRPQLAMLRALSRKLLPHAGTAWNTIKLTVSRSTRVAKAATTTGLALVGSAAGYQLVRHTAAAGISGATRLVTAAFRCVAGGLRSCGQLVLSAIDLVSPVASGLIGEVTSDWIHQPAARLADRFASWVRDATSVVWELSDTALVRTATVRAAQVASVILAAHALTRARSQRTSCKLYRGRWMRSWFSPIPGGQRCSSVVHSSPHSASQRCGS